MLTINATHIGRKLDGIGKFSLFIAKHFLGKYKIVINQEAKSHFSQEELRKLKILSGKLSPEKGKISHIYRLLTSNLFSGTILNLSQLEVSLWNSKQIVVVHDIIPFLFPKDYPLQYPYYKYVLPKVLKRCKLIIATSFCTKRSISTHYEIEEDKIAVIYNGIPLPKPKTLSHKEEFILFVGRNDPRKNLKTLLKAFSLAREKHPSLRLLIAGCKVPEPPGVKSLGYVEETELEKLYRKAKALVMPSLYEGFGYPILEAMARGTAVIATKTSSIPEIAGDSALYVDEPKNPRELSLKIIKLLNDNGLRKKLEIRGLERVGRFSIDKTLQEYESLLKRITQ